jgi:copper chaperone NosL
MRRSLLLATLLAAACGRGTDAPPAIAYGQVNCDYCHMSVEVERRAAQLVPVAGRPRVFDESGCLLHALAVAGAPEPGDRLWVHDEATGAWIDARTAFFVLPSRPPAGMMYGVLAYADRARAAARRGEGRVVDFAAALAAVRS